MGYFFTLAYLLLLYMSLWFILSLVIKRNDIADVAWGFGFVLLAWMSFFLGNMGSERGILIGLLISIWGIRLAAHIYARNRKKTEDYRYEKWRKEWGSLFYIRSYLQVYLLQGFLLFLISVPVMIMNRSVSRNLWFGDYVGVAVWLAGFLFESVGDAQLARFIKNPANKGKLMQEGLWRYTRHPNYFGEVVLWWGVWIIAFSTPIHIVGIIGPLIITFLILKVSGIPMLEKKMEKHPEFPEYKRRTSVFIPWFPRNGV